MAEVLQAETAIPMNEQLREAVSNAFASPQHIFVFLFAAIVILVFVSDRYNRPTYSREHDGFVALIAPRFLASDSRYAQGLRIYASIILGFYVFLVVAGKKVTDAILGTEVLKGDPLFYPLAIALFIIGLSAAEDKGLFGNLELRVRRFAHERAFIPNGTRLLARRIAQDYFGTWQLPAQQSVADELLNDLAFGSKIDAQKALDTIPEYGTARAAFRKDVLEKIVKRDERSRFVSFEDIDSKPQDSKMQEAITKFRRRFDGAASFRSYNALCRVRMAPRHAKEYDLIAPDFALEMDPTFKEVEGRFEKIASTLRSKLEQYATAAGQRLPIEYSLPDTLKSHNAEIVQLRNDMAILIAGALMNSRPSDSQLAAVLDQVGLEDEGVPMRRSWLACAALIFGALTLASIVYLVLFAIYGELFAIYGPVILEWLTSWLSSSQIADASVPAGYNLQFARMAQLIQNIGGDAAAFVSASLQLVRSAQIPATSVEEVLIFVSKIFQSGFGVVNIPQAIVGNVIAAVDAVTRAVPLQNTGGNAAEATGIIVQSLGFALCTAVVLYSLTAIIGYTVRERLLGDGEWRENAFIRAQCTFEVCLKTIPLCIVFNFLVLPPQPGVSWIVSSAVTSGATSILAGWFFFHHMRIASRWPLHLDSLNGARPRRIRSIFGATCGGASLHGVVAMVTLFFITYLSFMATQVVQRQAVLEDVGTAAAKWLEQHEEVEQAQQVKVVQHRQYRPGYGKLVENARSGELFDQLTTISSMTFQSLAIYSSETGREQFGQQLLQVRNICSDIRGNTLRLPGGNGAVNQPDGSCDQKDLGEKIGLKSNDDSELFAQNPKLRTAVIGLIASLATLEFSYERISEDYGKLKLYAFETAVVSATSGFILALLFSLLTSIGRLYEFDEFYSALSRAGGKRLFRRLNEAGWGEQKILKNDELKKMSDQKLGNLLAEWLAKPRAALFEIPVQEAMMSEGSYLRLQDQLWLASKSKRESPEESGAAIDIFSQLT